MTNLNQNRAGWQTAHGLALVGITQNFGLKTSGVSGVTNAATDAQRGGAVGAPGALRQLPPDGNHGGNISGDYKNV